MSVSSWPVRQPAYASPSAYRAVRRPRSGTSKLHFTDLLFIAVLATAYMLTMSTPLFGVQLQMSVLKHVPLALFVPVLTIHYAGLSLHRVHRPWHGIFVACWPLLLMAAYALVGSAVAKWEYKVEDSYIAFGTYLILLPACAGWVGRADAVHAWVRAITFLWLTFATLALIGALGRFFFSVREALHEIEYLVIAAYVLAFYFFRNRLLKMLAILLLLATAVVNGKLTGYIIAVFALFYMGFDVGWRRTPPSWRGLYVIITAVSLVAAVMAMAALYFEFKSYLPSGNPEVRLKQYEQAIIQFRASPIWGNAYTAGSGEIYREYLRLYNIPTHSDILDMLKHGGLIGVGLFVVGYLKIYRLLSRAATAGRDDRVANAYFTAMRFFLVSALVTFSFNPLLLKGPYLFVIWSSIGLAVGLALLTLQRSRGS